MDMSRGDRDVWWLLPGKDKGTSLAERTEGKQGNASLAMDSEGVIYAAWHSKGMVVICSSKNPKNDIVSTESEADYPSVGAGGGGAVVVYECMRDGKQVVICRELSH
jgi:hypothetical protein